MTADLAVYFAAKGRYGLFFTEPAEDYWFDKRQKLEWGEGRSGS